MKGLVRIIVAYQARKVFLTQIFEQSSARLSNKVSFVLIAVGSCLLFDNIFFLLAPLLSFFFTITIAPAQPSFVFIQAFFTTLAPECQRHWKRKPANPNSYQSQLVMGYDIACIVSVCVWCVWESTLRGACEKLDKCSGACRIAVEARARACLLLLPLRMFVSIKCMRYLHPEELTTPSLASAPCVTLVWRLILDWYAWCAVCKWVWSGAGSKSSIF